MPPKVDQVQCKAKGIQERARGRAGGRAGVSSQECRHVGAQKGARPSPHLPWNLIGFSSHTLPCRFSIPKALLSAFNGEQRYNIKGPKAGHSQEFWTTKHIHHRTCETKSFTDHHCGFSMASTSTYLARQIL
ncbi:hypothetical protein SDJN03_11014, partial [Cucurbita argyrosperma subsp. sororia]